MAQTQQTVTRPIILLVDPNPATSSVSKAAFEHEDVDTVVVACGAEALRLLAELAIDCVVLDLATPPGAVGTPRGSELLAAIAALENAPPIIAVTAQASLSAAVESVRAGAFDYLARPFAQARLTAAVTASMKSGKPRSPLPSRCAAPGGSPDFGGFIGRSETMRQVYDVLARAAHSTASVFITGESGTGKELAAEALHRQGPRARRHLVALNCGAIPRELAGLEQRGFATIAADVEAAFLADGWPGNVRELQNVIHSAVVLNDGAVLERHMLPCRRFAAAAAQAGASVTPAGFAMRPQDRVAEALDADGLGIERLCTAERQYIEWAIDRCDGNLQAAARRLGISPSTIYRKKESWGRAPLGAGWAIA